MYKIHSKKKMSTLAVIHRNEVLHLRDEVRLLKIEIHALKLGIVEERHESKKPIKISFLSNGCHRMVNLTDILYCKAHGNYSRIFLAQDESLFISKTLKEIEALLSSAAFARCHQSFVVNLSHVRSYTGRGSLSLEISSGERIPVSRRNKSKILSRL